jgi:hypothetical protein
MKNLFIFVLVLMSSYAQAARYQICVGEFAFCGASGATPTGRTITVNTPTGTAEFNEAMAECPVFTGPAVADVLVAICKVAAMLLVPMRFGACLHQLQKLLWLQTGVYSPLCREYLSAAQRPTSATCLASYALKAELSTALS